jgi:DNA-binding transcriptional ArsR family regulator
LAAYPEELLVGHRVSFSDEVLAVDARVSTVEIVPLGGGAEIDRARLRKYRLTVSQNLRMITPTENTILAALGDPRRGEILRQLASGPRSVADLARELPISRPAVSQHLRVLSLAGLVTYRPAGRAHYYQLDLRGLAALRTFLDSLWQAGLDDFKAAAERTSPRPQRRRRK